MNNKLTLQSGVTLIELLISLVISAMILAGVVQLYATSTTNTVSFEGTSRIQENARYVFGRINEDTIQAGNGGCLSLASAVSLGRISSVLANNSATDELYDLESYVGGAEGGVNDSDTLILRYADQSKRIPVTSYVPGAQTMTLDTTDADNLAKVNKLKKGQVVYVANCSRMAAMMITDISGGVITFAEGADIDGQSNNSLDLKLGAAFSVANSDSAAPSASLAYLYGGDSVVEYKIGKSASAEAADACDADNPQFCALFRNGIEIAEGVQAFDVQYGWEEPGKLFLAPLSEVTDTKLVDRIALSITLNSIDTAPTLTGENAEARYLTKTFSRTYMIRNQLPVN